MGLSVNEVRIFEEVDRINLRKPHERRVEKASLGSIGVYCPKI